MLHLSRAKVFLSSSSSPLLPSLSPSLSQSLLKPSLGLGACLQVLPRSPLSSAASSPPVDITTLPNGLRVASTDNLQMTSSVSIFLETGTRFETPSTHGMTQLLERMVLKGTKRMEGEEFLHQFQNLGGTAMGMASREIFSLGGDVIRENMEDFTKLLGEALVEPRFTQEELQQQQMGLQYEWQRGLEEDRSDGLMQDLLHQAAYGGDMRGGIAEAINLSHTGGLGTPLLCPFDRISEITPEGLGGYLEEQLVGSRIVVSGVGVDHSALLSAVEDSHLAAIPSSPSSSSPPRTPLSQLHLDAPSPSPKRPYPSASPYVGGQWLVADEGMPSQRVVLGFEAPNVHHPDFYPACVLNMLLGGGDSFSAGGPGKGMYSRLYKRVLNSYYWVSSCTAFNSAFSDSAIFGISGAALMGSDRQAVKPLLDVIYQELFSLTEAGAVGGEAMSAIALERAKKQLKSSIFMNLETRAIACEDLGKQIMLYGKYVRPEEHSTLIDKVTADDIFRVVENLLTSKPSMSVMGTPAAIEKIPGVDQLHEFVLKKIGK